MSAKRLEEKFRLDLLLAMLPTLTTTTTTTGLRVTQCQERLRAQGIEVDDRTIQRNLKALLDDKRYGVKRKKKAASTYIGQIRSCPDSSSNLPMP